MAQTTRTPEAWRTYDRWKLIGAIALVLLLLLLWLVGWGPGRAVICCGAPAAEAPPPVTQAPASRPAVTPAPAPEPPVEKPAPPPPVPEPTAPNAAVAEPACPRSIRADVLFATNSAVLTGTGRETITKLVPCVKEGRFEVSGHADTSGNDAINEPLSEARAKAVVEYLVSQGVEPGQLSARGYGSRRPVADNATPEGRALNRRVEITRQ